MKARTRFLLILLLTGLALGACGNKGDLVLPDPPEPETQGAEAAR